MNVNLFFKNFMIFNIEILDIVIFNLFFYKYRGFFKILVRRNVNLYLVIINE